MCVICKGYINYPVTWWLKRSQQHHTYNISQREASASDFLSWKNTANMIILQCRPVDDNVTHSWMLFSVQATPAHHAYILLHPEAWISKHWDSDETILRCPVLEFHFRGEQYKGNFVCFHKFTIFDYRTFSAHHCIVRLQYSGKKKYLNLLKLFLIFINVKSINKYMYDVPKNNTQKTK